MKKLAQGFNTAAQDSNPGSRSRESEALPLSHCALLNCNMELIPDCWHSFRESTFANIEFSFRKKKLFGNE